LSPSADGETLFTPFIFAAQLVALLFFFGRVARKEKASKQLDVT